jgi:hypothetical protein
VLEIPRMKKFFILLIAVSTFTSVLAQEDEQSSVKRSTPSPDFPGSLQIEYGLNYFYQNSREMRTNPWRSATINVYFTYPIQIGDSRFSFNPGVGIGSEKFGFEDPVTLKDSITSVTVMRNVAELPRFENMNELIRTQFVANYIDIPMEFRVHTRKNDHKRSWYIALGGKIGFNFDAKTKIKYQEFGRTKTYKDKFNFNVNSVRYGAIGRIGVGPINFWVYYSGSKLFRGNKAFNFENPSMWSFGLSLATF